MEGLLCESMGAQGWPGPVRLRGALGFVWGDLTKQQSRV